MTYTATISPSPDGGTVAFFDGPDGILGCATQPLTSNAATCAVTYTTSGSHTIGATYSGTTNFASSSSTTVAQVVNEAATYTLSGTVTAAGNPHDGTVVYVVLPDGTYIGNTTTAGGGHYSISLASGDYKLYLQPNLAGYPDQYYGGSDLASATVVTVSANTVKDIALVGPPASFTLSGTVTAAGNPHDGTVVHVVLPDGTYIGNTTTAGGGHYSISLASGDYKLYLQPNLAGYPDQYYGGSDLASATVVTVSANTVKDIALVGPPASFTLSGTVTAAGNPHDGTVVHVVLPDGTYIGNTTTAGGGHYSISLASGDYKLYLQPNLAGYPDQYYGGSDLASATVVTVSANTVKDIALVGPPASFTLSGTVTAAGNPHDGTVVHVVLPDGTYIGNTTTAGGGHYSISLASGDYKLYLQPNLAGYPDQYYGGSDLASATVVTVSANTVKDIALVGPPASFTLSGTVTAAGNPHDGTVVHVVLPDGTYIGNTTTAGGGHYSISLASGDYKLYLQPNLAGYPDQYYGGSDLASATVVTVSANTVKDIALVGPPASFTLSGTVTAAGNPHDGTVVHVVLPDGTYIGNTTTAGGGHYSISLASGDYKLYLQPNLAGYPDQYYGGSDLASATVVTVSANTVKDIALVPG